MAHRADGVSGPSGQDLPAVAFRAGNLIARFGRDEADVEAAQALRYRVFYEEMMATPTPQMSHCRRDFDKFDAFADHILVIDTDTPAGGEVVGTYRLIRRAVAEKLGGFYTADEYDIGRLTDWPGEVLELGRSCVASRYRTSQAMQLLWQAIAAYVFEYRIGLMFGCASLPGVDVQALRLPLSYLYHFHLAAPEMRPVAVPDRYVDMNCLGAAEIDRKAALADLPPLIKGYLRLGGVVGDGAVIDRQFNTTDVCMVVQTDLVSKRYYRHYARRFGERGMPAEFVV